VSSFADDPRTVVDTFSDPIVVVDDRLTITSANQAAANLVGVESAGDLVGQSGLEWVHEPDRIDATERLAALTVRQQSSPVSLRLVRRDLSLIWVEITGAVIATPAGTVRYVLGFRNVDWRHESDLDAARVVRRSHALVTAALALQSAPADRLIETLAEVVADVGLSVGARVVAVHEVEHDGATVTLRARWASASAAASGRPSTEQVPLQMLPNVVDALNSARRVAEAGHDHPIYGLELSRIEPVFEAGVSIALAPGDRLLGALTVGTDPGFELSSDERDFLVRAALIIGVALQRVRSHQALVESEAMFRDMFERSSAIMYLVDPLNLRLADVNEAAARFYGYSRQTMTGMDLHDLTIHTRDELVKLVAGVRAGGTTVIDEQQCLASGEIRTVEIHSTPMRLGDRVLDLAIVHDVTEQRRAVERLERLASTDDLTGAYNRRRFLALVADEIERCERYEREMSLLMLDLDHFKSINDSFGHLAGDATLVAFSDECSNHLRANDRFARMGGEEFAILMPEAGIADAAALGERLRLAVEQLVVPDVDGAPHTTVSIGGAQWEHGWSTDELFARADRMLYRAKQAGRNRFEG
jgi:two-component system, cell cycle response regulator